MNAAIGHEPLTRSVEDYLKVIYSLSPEGRTASTSDIAHRLELSAPSVSGMIKRLSEQGLLEHIPYKGVQLTAEGRRAALRMIRRHRILEAYLVARLGYTWDAVHEEADRLEHAVSEGLIERMAEALGNPDADPHGEPDPLALTGHATADALVHALGHAVHVHGGRAGPRRHLRHREGLLSHAGLHPLRRPDLLRPGQRLPAHHHLAGDDAGRAVHVDPGALR